MSGSASIQQQNRHFPSIFLFLHAAKVQSTRQPLACRLIRIDTLLQQLFRHLNISQNHRAPQKADSGSRTFFHADSFNCQTCKLIASSYRINACAYASTRTQRLKLFIEKNSHIVFCHELPRYLPRNYTTLQPFDAQLYSVDLSCHWLYSSRQPRPAQASLAARQLGPLFD